MSARRRQANLAPGARIVVRDAEWVVRRVDHSSDGGLQLVCDGISELVRSQEGVFLTSLDTDIEVLDARRTNLVRDRSPAFVRSRLFMESQLRRAGPSDERIRVGHKAAMRQVPYQLVPAVQALQQVRQRILIADAVGLGKTLEAGILVSELIARGRGRRILVLAIKSMLTQFQKEFWNRFTIPLTRLDSEGIRRVRNRIPTNHNPFQHYDKAIISIDTLKRDREYRVNLESAYWDIIVIDEAHNVADRGTGSDRSRLARLLAKRSDSLIMLSATPHDGRARSFASLVNMLDPTAITDPDDYGHADFRDKGLVVRRFKKDIRDQVTEAFRDRETHCIKVQPGPAEESAHESLLAVKVAGKRSGPMRRDLFVVGLEKALFSSPAACAETVAQRIRKRESDLSACSDASARPELEAELASLRELRSALSAIDRQADTRYQMLLRAIRGGQPFHWRGTDPDDRLVIFTERIATMDWLACGLKRDLRLKSGQVEVLHGGMSDRDQQDKVEAFGNEDCKVRLLVCSDVASEGINLHYRCHRLIHYDMPWSLMVFQQRNGRIDRYGQERTPEIVYLSSQSRNATIRGDQRILEVLREKDDQAYRNIGDPSAFAKVHSIEAEEQLTSEAIAANEDAEAFAERLRPDPSAGDELLALFLGSSVGEAGNGDAAVAADASATESMPSPETQAAPLSMFADEISYCGAALHQLRLDNPQLDFEVDRQTRSVRLVAPADLEHRFGYLPSEIWPDKGSFELTADTAAVERAVVESRKSERTWPRKQYLWRQHPVVEWLNDRMLATFGRHEAPVLGGVPGLLDGETAFVFVGTALNRKSHPLVSVRGAAMFRDGSFSECIPLEQLLDRTGLRAGEAPNRLSEPDLQPMRRLLPEAVERAAHWVRDARNAINDRNDRQLQGAMDQLEALKDRQLQRVQQAVEGQQVWESLKRKRIEQRSAEIKSVFADWLDWVQDSMTLDGDPWIQVLCAMTGEA